MNESQHNILSLNILGKIYQIKCPQDKVAELREAAQYLETKMRETSHASKPSIDRLAVVTALNIAHDLISQKKQIHTYMDGMNQKIRTLQIKIDGAVASSQEKEL